MHSAATKRALSTLAAKIHPQLPLSPRESQQLLNLLTTSFRAHLDRAHPLALSEASQDRNAQNLPGHNAPRSSSPARAASSYLSTTRHIDSILTNPLFAVKPRRRGPEPAAVDVLRDPMTWFLNEIATGAATLPKAALCLEALENAVPDAPRRPSKTPPASTLAEWLRTSGIDSSSQFLDLCVTTQGRASNFLARLMKLLLAEGESSAPWRWFIRSNEQRIKDTGFDLAKVIRFRQKLLLRMTDTQASTSLSDGLTTFMQAFRMAEIEGHDLTYSMLRPAGGHLVNCIISTPNLTIDPVLYQDFLQSTPRWLGNWSPAAESMLWLHHPTKPDALFGLRFIRDPAGAITFIHSSRSRRNFLVQLCLGIAHELMEMGEFEEAQVAMQFTKENFADIVSPKPLVMDQRGTSGHKDRKEKENLEILDRLIPT